MVSAANQVGSRTKKSDPCSRPGGPSSSWLNHQVHIVASFYPIEYHISPFWGYHKWPIYIYILYYIYISLYISLYIYIIFIWDSTTPLSPWNRWTLLPAAPLSEVFFFAGFSELSLSSLGTETSTTLATTGTETWGVGPGAPGVSHHKKYIKST